MVREQKEDNPIGNMHLYFIIPDFGMRLDKTQVNEEKWHGQYIVSHPIKH